MLNGEGVADFNPRPVDSIADGEVVIVAREEKEEDGRADRGGEAAAELEAEIEPLVVVAAAGREVGVEGEEDMGALEAAQGEEEREVEAEA